jgi:hypothetical protein
MKVIHNANKQGKPVDISIRDVKECEVFKDFTDEQAQQVIDTIRTYTEIIYCCFTKGRLTKQTGSPAKLINMPTTKNTKVA